LKATAAFFVPFSLSPEQEGESYVPIPVAKRRFPLSLIFGMKFLI
jgi:hypothetical protein